MLSIEAPASRPHIVVVGGGVAALETIAALRALAPQLADVTLVAPPQAFRYRALELGEPFGLGTPRHHDLEALATGLGATFEPDALVEVDQRHFELHLRSGKRLRYDRLVLALGALPYPAYAHGIVFDRPASPDSFDELLSDVDEGYASSAAVVVPEGVRWTLPAYELALMLRAWAAGHGRELDVHLITPEPAPLSLFGVGASRVVGDVLARHGIILHTGSVPVVMSDAAVLAGGQWLTVSRIVSLPRLAGLRVRGLDVDDRGFIAVDADGAVAGAHGVYAAGDGTQQDIKQGGLASQQGDRVAAALARWLGVRDVPEPEGPFLRAILATPEGPLFFTRDLAERPASTLELPRCSPDPLWSPPTKVATRHLGAFLHGRESTPVPA